MKIETTERHVIGYARDSMRLGNLEQQLAVLRPICSAIYADNSKSSSKASHEELSACLNALRSGDVLVVYSLDRLATGLKDLEHTLSLLNQKGVVLRSLTEKIDTEHSSGQQFLHTFRLVRQFERNAKGEHITGALRIAREDGRIGGRKTVVSKELSAEMSKLYNSKKMTVVDICQRYGVSKSTFYRAVKHGGYKFKEGKN